MAKTTEILYSVGKTRLGDLIRAGDAQKGECYTCPECDNDLILRKGKIKRPHFAHKAISPNCKPESVLHYVFKKLLAAKIQSFIDSKKQLPIKWRCEQCRGWHTGNLLKKSVEVKIEHNLGAVVPDIALINQGGRVCCVIEVVVSHLPSKEATEWYAENNIPVLIIRLESDADIDVLDNDALCVSLWNKTICRCNVCGGDTLRDKSMLVVSNYPCARCGKRMKCALVIHGEAVRITLTLEEVVTARNAGAFVRAPKTPEFWDYAGMEQIESLKGTPLYDGLYEPCCIWCKEPGYRVLEDFKYNPKLLDFMYGWTEYSLGYSCINGC